MPRHPETAVTSNLLLQGARRRLPSPLRPGKCMSRSEFVTAVNAHLHAVGVLDADIDYDYVVKLEAGKHRWPRDERRRSAIRAVLRVRDDAEIGFHRERRSRADEEVLVSGDLNLGQAAAGITSANRTGLFSDWNPSRLDVYEGTCRILLKEPAAAVVHLERASTVLNNDHENTNVALAAQVDLASAYAHTGHLDMACRTLGAAYDQLKRIGNLRGISRARRAREGLSQWNAERVIQELDERMAAA